MIARITQLTVLPEGEPLFSDIAHTVTIDDEGAGEYVVVKSLSEHYGKIAIDVKEWPALKDAIDRMIQECKA